MNRNFFLNLLYYYLSVGAGCSCQSKNGSTATSNDDMSNSSKDDLPTPRVVHLKAEFEEVLAKLLKAQENIYSLVSENLMIFYKQVGQLYKNG